MDYDAEESVYMVIADGYGALRVNAEGQVYSLTSGKYETLGFYPPTFG